MKPRSFRYLVGEGFKNTWVNRLMTLASIGVLVACMVVIGLADLISKNISVYLQGLQEQNVVFAFLKDENWKRLDPEAEEEAAATSEKSASSTQKTTSQTTFTVNQEAVQNGNYTVKTDAEAETVRNAIEKLGNIKMCVYVSSTYASDYARMYMTKEEYACYEKALKSGNGALPRGVFLELKDPSVIKQTITDVMAVSGVAAAYTSDISSEKGHIVAYLDDAGWALCHTKVEPEPVDEPEIESEASPSKPLPEDGFWIHNEKEANAVAAQIRALNNVKDAEYISGEQAFDEAIEYMAKNDKKYFADWKDDEDLNPMSCAIKVSMKDMKLFDQTIRQIGQMDEVSAIRSHRDAATKIEALKKGITIAGIAIMVILIGISLMIVSNTIRITMYNRKLEISIMKAVGATNAFIRVPFVVEGMLIGAFSALISEAVVYFCYRVATETISESLNMFNVISFSSVWLRLLGLFLIIGIAAGAFGSFIMIRKYLRREGSEFAAI